MSEPGAVRDPAGPDPEPLVVRPRRIAIIGSIAAAAILATVIVLGLMLQSGGVELRTVDRVGFMSVGLLGAGAIMLVARPRVVVDTRGMTVRNVLGETFLPWQVIQRISFPKGAHWAQIVLADDEAFPLLAIQAMDKQRAADALARVREMHRTYAPPPPVLSEEAAARARRRAVAEAAAAAARPLGRLEQIDREMAAKGPKPRRKDRRAAR